MELLNVTRWFKFSGIWACTAAAGYHPPLLLAAFHLATPWTAATSRSTQSLRVIFVSRRKKVGEKKKKEKRENRKNGHGKKVLPETETLPFRWTNDGIKFRYFSQLHQPLSQVVFSFHSFAPLPQRPLIGLWFNSKFRLFGVWRDGPFPFLLTRLQNLPTWEWWIFLWRINLSLYGFVLNKILCCNKNAKDSNDSKAKSTNVNTKFS